ncbi:MAG: HPr family phosphocarrier protein [Desulfobacteraceae bacterium]|nr:MAG: HPr family phosphocarrier protein [Desulfobacteraceae bacterium]
MELKKSLQIINELGLHARSAAKIVGLAKAHQAKLYLKKGEKEVDGSSILSLLSLSCPQGTEVEARADGADAESLLQALTELFERKFDEGR